MIVTSKMMIRNAHSGAAGNQTICVNRVHGQQKQPHGGRKSLREQREAREPDDRAEDQVDPAPGGDVGDDHPVAADDHILVVENPGETPERVEPLRP